MAVESAGWQKYGIEAVIDGETMWVPDDMANRHRQMIAEWEAEGNVIEPYVEPAPLPAPKPAEEPVTRAEFDALEARVAALEAAG